MVSVWLWWKVGYLRRGGEAAAPPALKDRFIPKGFLVWWALLWLRWLPLCCEYSHVSQTGSPLTPNLATEHQRG